MGRPDGFQEASFRARGACESSERDNRNKMSRACRAKEPRPTTIDHC
jgi:hypothetical protein